jgi:hypothetical protein
LRLNERHFSFPEGFVESFNVDYEFALETRQGAKVFDSSLNRFGLTLGRENKCIPNLFFRHGIHNNLRVTQALSANQRRGC